MYVVAAGFDLVDEVRTGESVEVPLGLAVGGVR